MVGIYKITSPLGKVYIGQSMDIERRFKWYRTIRAIKCPLIQRSIKKYGSDAHIFEVIHELPIDVEKKDLSRYEQFYMDQYRECGFRMLNLSAALESPYGVKRSEEWKKNYAEKMKQYPPPMLGKKHSEETKDKIRKIRATQNPAKGTKRTPEQLRQMSISRKGKKRSTPYKPCSEETKQKLRLANLGKRLSEETKKKVSDNHPKYWLGKKMSDAVRKKMSDAHKKPTQYA